MLEMQKIFNQLGRKIALVMLVVLVWLISLPTTSVQADGYFSEKNRKVETSKPYYSVKDRRVAQYERDKPYYATKERSRERATERDYIDGGKRAGNARDYNRSGIETDLEQNRADRRNLD